MSNNIPKVTQDEFESNIETNPRLTMALPNLAPIKKKMHQMGIFGKQALKGVIVPAHMRGSKLVDSYEKKVKSKAKGNKKVKADCKESLELVSFLVWQDKIKIMKDIKNNK